MAFEESIEFTLEREGYLSNDKDDAGGLTKYGISAAAFPGLDIKNLTLEEAKAIYKREYWDKMHCDDLPLGVDHLVFDFGVNSGCSTSIKTLQRAINTCLWMHHNKDKEVSQMIPASAIEGSVAVDGIIGPATIKSAMAEENIANLCEVMLRMRETFYESLAKNNPTQQKFLKGWLNRVELNRQFVKKLLDV